MNCGTCLLYVPVISCPPHGEADLLFQCTWRKRGGEEIRKATYSSSAHRITYCNKYRASEEAVIMSKGW